MKPWEQHWRAVGRDATDYVEDVSGVGNPVATVRSAADARFIAAGQAMVKALCQVEWSGGEGDTECPWCGGNESGGVHHSTCRLDQALTAAGLDAEARRKVRGER